jgi:hypothetical protein
MIEEDLTFASHIHQRGSTMVTYVIGAVRRDGLQPEAQMYYARSKQHPTDEQLRELERQGFKIIGVGRIVSTVRYP